MSDSTCVYKCVMSDSTCVYKCVVWHYTLIYTCRVWHYTLIYTCTCISSSASLTDRHSSIISCQRSVIKKYILLTLYFYIVKPCCVEVKRTDGCLNLLLLTYLQINLSTICTILYCKLYSVLMMNSGPPAQDQ
jgi:hypothetical protein